MEEKDISQYIDNAVKKLQEYGIKINNDSIEKIKQQYIDTEISYEKKTEEIDSKVQLAIENARHRKDREKSMQEKILRKQKEIYQGVSDEKEENNGNIKSIDITQLSDEELDKTCYHYSLKKDKNSIDKEGLKARIGRNSDGVDQLNSIYFSYGIEGVLETWDVWLKWRLNRLNNPYWQEENKEIQEAIRSGTASKEEKYEFYSKCQQWEKEFTSGEYKDDTEKLEFLYKFQMDEMLASNYYILDLKEGEEYSFDEVDVKKKHNLGFKNQPDRITQYKVFKEMYGKYSDFESNKVDKWNMNTILGKEMTIEPSRIKQLSLPNGKRDVLSVINYFYDKYKENTPEEEQVQFDLLDDYMEFAKEKIKNNEIEEFDRNDRINQSERISYFHDQSSDVFFKDNSHYTITPNQIGKKSIYTDIGKKDIAR